PGFSTGKETVGETVASIDVLNRTVRAKVPGSAYRSLTEPTDGVTEVTTGAGDAVRAHISRLCAWSKAVKNSVPAPLVSSSGAEPIGPGIKSPTRVAVVPSLDQSSVPLVPSLAQK